MLGVETATLRAWEERYGVVVPTRSKGAQRVYSRDELEQLRFVVDLVEAGTTAGGRPPAAWPSGCATRGACSRPIPTGVTIVVLLAERDRYAAELLEYFLRTEGYDVCVAFDPDARRAAVRRTSTRPVDRRSDDRRAAVSTSAPAWRARRGARAGDVGARPRR